MNASDRVSWTGRIAFGLGSYAEGIKNASFNYFLLFFYNQVLGLPGSLAGAALAIALVFDAVSDPVVGSLSDRHHSRRGWGRRHPFMYGAAIPFAIVFFLVFNPPAGLSEFGLFIWLLVFAVACRVGLTFYAVPHMTLGAELSQDYDERTTLAAVRAFLAIGGGVSIILLGYTVFFGGDGQLERSNYAPFAATAACVMALSILVSAAGTHSYIPRLQSAPEDAVSFSPARLARELMSALRVQQFRLLLGSLLVNAAISGVLATLATYILTFYFELQGAALGSALAVGMGGGVMGALISSPLAARMGSKRNAIVLGMLWFAIFTSLLVNLRLLGLAPGNEHPALLPMLLTGGFIGGLGLGLTQVLSNSMIADVTDEHERRYGDRQEGIYYSAVTLVGKATSGLGAMLAGASIDLVGLDPEATPGAVPDAVITGLGLIYGPGVLVLSVIPVILIWRYDIDRKRHEEIRREIDHQVGAAST